jgi:16S rRNA (guanine527-N7)-methyltransferase
MREPAIQTASAREDRNATGGSIFVSGADAAAADPGEAARAARIELERLLASAPDLASRLPPGFTDAAERYVALLLAANERLNLTRITAPADVARLHLLDALAALPLLDNAAPRSAVDLGSGGGVPGLVLAVARPQIEWVLVDAVQKKARALASFVEALRLASVEIVAARAEDLGRAAAHREQHDLVTARACAELPVLAELALPLLGIGGQLLAWKGPLTGSDPELRRGAAAASQLGGGEPRLIEPGVPELGGHTFVMLPKAAPTPPRFPRRPGEPSRRPLA